MNKFFFTLFFILLLTIISLGCNNNFSLLGNTGKLKIAVLWPEKNNKLHINTIPKDTSKIMINIKGEGLATSYIDTITRGADPIEKKTVTLPSGNKTIKVYALDSRSTMLAEGEAFAVVEVNKIRTVEITLNEVKGVAVFPSPTIIPAIFVSGSQAAGNTQGTILVNNPPLIMPSVFPTYFPYYNIIPTPYYSYYPTPIPTPYLFIPSSLTTSSLPKTIPDIPSYLNKFNLTQTGFTLTWNSVQGATSYKVYKNGSLYTDNVTGNSIGITGLFTDTTYSMQVSAVNEMGESAKSTAFSITTLILLPSIPTSLSNAGMTSINCKLSWNSSTGATSYKVYNNGVLYAENITTTSTTITGLTSNTIYNMQVCAVNEAGTSEKSSALSITTWLEGILMTTPFSTTNAIKSSPAIGSDGTIYVTSTDGKLYAIKPDGAQKWTPPFDTGNSVYASPVIGTDGTIYVGNSENKLYAVNPNGIQKWLFYPGGLDTFRPAIGPDGTIYVASSDGKLYAINPANGAQKWVYAAGTIVSSPAIGADGTIYFGCNSTNILYAIKDNGSSASLKWDYATSGVINSSPAIGSDGTIYVGCTDNKLYAIKDNGSSSSLKWSYATGGAINSSPAIATDGTIYVGCDDSKLYAIKPDGTTFKWYYPLAPAAASINSSPAIGSDGVIYIGSADNNLYAIQDTGFTGELKWAYTALDIIESSPTIGTDGIVYVGSNDNNLYMLSSESAGLMNSAWPKVHKNIKNTGLF